jgi:hypothetical protein
MDSLHYALISCGAADTATVYIITLQDIFSACAGASITMTLPDIPNITYVWYDGSMGGTAVSTTNTYTVVKDGSGDTVWPVDVLWNGLKFYELSVSLIEGFTSSATLVSHFTGDTLIQSGVSTTVTAHALADVVNPVYYWYAEATGGTVFHTGESYTTSLLTTDTTFYVAVSGDNSCVTTDRKAVTVHTSPPPEANNDRYSVYTNTTIVCDVLANDDVSVCSDPQITIVSSSVNVEANVVGGKINYKSASGFVGVDSLIYQLSCSSGIAEAKVYIVVSKPVGAPYVACTGTTVTAGFKPVEYVSYSWYESEAGGSHDNSPSNAHDCTAPSVWWVEAKYRDTVAGPRLKVVIDAYSAPQNYPDLRIRVCPDAGMSVNLSKYIDTLGLTYLNWSSVSPNISVTSLGVISADHLNVHAGVYTLSYTVNNPCLTSAITRRVYLETLKPDRMRPLRDTLVICSEHAEAVQINQIFGIDANGTWTYYSNSSGDVSTYVTESASATYSGAVVMNGKGIYDDGSIAYYEYHGINNAKKVVFTYLTDDNSCLHSKEYKIVIILTPDMMH